MINPDLEQFSHVPRSPADQLRDFDDAVAHYAVTRRAEMDVSLEVGLAGGLPDDPLRQRLCTAVAQNHRAKETIVALALVMSATGLLERCIEMLDPDFRELNE